MRFKIPYWPLLVVPSLAFGIGFCLNAIVMSANNGQMPVLFPGGCPADGLGDDFIHTCMTQATHIKFLADWVVIRHLGIASPGDFFEWFHEATFWPSLTAWVALVVSDASKSRCE